MAAAAHDISTPEGRQAALDALDPDLHGLLERKVITEQVRAKLSVAGISALSRFASIADSKAEVRSFCHDVLGLDRVHDAAEIAGVVDSWSAAQARIEARHKAEAESDLTGIPQVMSKVEMLDVRGRFERLHYTLDEKAVPSSTTLEMICDQIEAGELKVITLAQVQSREDAETESFGCMVERAA